jgi:PAS domain S-box-containing protein
LLTVSTEPAEGRLPRPWRVLRRRWTLIVASIVVAAGAAAWAALWWAPVAKGPYRIGFENDPPYHFPGPDGQPRGWAFEAIAEAARRSGIDLQWTFCPESSEAAIRSDRVDLWPIMTDLPRRRSFIYFSDHWMHTDLYVLLRQPDLELSPSFTGAVGHVAFPLYGDLLRAGLPGAREVVFASDADTTRALCRREVDGILVSLSDITANLVSPDPNCEGVPLHWKPLPGGSINQSIGARPAQRIVADRLRRELDGMARDGTLTRILSRYSFFGLGEVVKTFELLETRERAVWLGRGVVGLSAALLISIGLSLSLNRARRALARANAAKAEFVERYELAAQATNDIIWEWDPASRARRWSEALREQLGHAQVEIREAWWEDRIHAEDRERVIRGLREALEGSLTRWTDEYRFQDGKGGYAWVADRSRIRRDSAGRATGMTGAMEDVTQRRRLEEQLRQAQKMEAVGRLAGGIAHDFNNLLTVINGYSELLLRALGPGSPLRSHASGIQKAGEQAASLVRQLLAFSRRQVVEPRLIDLNGAIREIEKTLLRLVGEDIRVEMDLSPTLGLVRADPGQVGQVLLNLAVNARDAMPKGGTVTIETANRDPEPGDSDPEVESRAGAYVYLGVADTGVGMDERTRARVFEPFFTTRTRATSTGLGLSTVYGIARQAGGLVFVDSAPGRGSRFRVYWPRAEGRADDEGSNLRAAPVPSGAETILVVEDNEDVRGFAVEVLRDAGYHVLEATSSLSALEISARHASPIHLLLADVIMPGLNGMQLAERVGESRPETHVLFMSGYSHDLVADKGAVARDINLLQKPFTPEALLTRVREALREGAEPL